MMSSRPFPAAICLRAVLPAAAAAGVIALAGCGAPHGAAASGPAGRTSAGRMSAGSTPARTVSARHAGGVALPKHAVHLIGYSIDSDGPRFKVIVTGAVGDHGPALTVHPNGTVDPEHTSELRLSLTRGAFRLRIAALNKKIVAAYTHWPHNQATCSGSISVTAPAPVVRGSGTGKYRGLTGGFTLTAMIDEVDAAPCDGTGSFISQVIVISGWGSVTVG